MTDKEQNIKTIVEICEAMQKGQDSDYTKERAIISAYERIKGIILGGNEDETGQ